MRISINRTSIETIYIMIIVSALSYLRFTVTDVYAWRIVYHASICGIILTGLTYIINRNTITIDFFVAILIAIICHELAVSIFNGLFFVPMTIADVIPWPLITIIFYDYFQKNEIPKSFEIITLIGMILICLLSIPNINARLKGGGNAAVFATYYCIAFLPLLFLTNPKNRGLFFSSLVSLMMLLSLKRAAFIITVLGLFLYYYVSIIIQRGSLKKLKKILILFIAGVVATISVLYIIQKMDLNILERLSNMVEDGGSGRVGIWTEIIAHFNNSKEIEKWFGHGFHAVFYEIKPLGIARYAHNSFLETLYDYGYIGLFLVLAVVIKILNATYKMIKKRSIYAPIMAYSLAPMFILGLASYFFEQSVIILPISALWGMCIGQSLREEQEGNCERNK